MSIFPWHTKSPYGSLFYSTIGGVFFLLSVFTGLVHLGVKGVAVLSIIIILSALLCFPVSAKQTSSNTFVMSCGTPSTGDTTGYLEILMKDPNTGDYTSRVFMWSASDSIGTLVGENYVYETDLTLDISIIKSDDRDVVRFYCTDSGKGVSARIYSLDAFNQRYIGSTIGYGQSKNYFDYDTSYDIVSYHIYGSYGLSVSGSLPMTEFYVLYAENGVIFNAITSGQQEQTNQIIQGQQEQTDKITQNDDENTQAIIDNQNQLAENEKNQANSIGNGGMDSLGSTVPNYYGNIIEAFKGFSNNLKDDRAMLIIDFPGLKIPKIGNLINKEIQLLEPQEIQWSEWHFKNIFGEDFQIVFNIIRALTSIALVYFCVRELYDIFEYLMTLRGDSDE